MSCYRNVCYRNVHYQSVLYQNVMDPSVLFSSGQNGPLRKKHEKLMCLKYIFSADFASVIVWNVKVKSEGWSRARLARIMHGLWVIPGTVSKLDSAEAWGPRVWTDPWCHLSWYASDVIIILTTKNGAVLVSSNNSLYMLILFLNSLPTAVLF